MINYELLFLKALFYTIFIETICLFLVVRFFLGIKKIKIKNSLLFFSGIFTSSVTLPYLWFIFPMFRLSYFYLSLYGELWVFIMETIMYFFLLRIGMKKALLISFFCNVISYLIGKIFL